VFALSEIIFEIKNEDLIQADCDCVNCCYEHLQMQLINYETLCYLQIVESGARESPFHLNGPVPGRGVRCGICCHCLCGALRWSLISMSEPCILIAIPRSDS
jgi:hypothetical protein